MANILKRKNRDGSYSFRVRIRLKGFAKATESFPTRVEAKRWAEKIEKELKAERTRGAVREDLATLSITSLINEYLADENVKALKHWGDRADLLNWWKTHYGGTRVVDFGVLMLREARGTLQRSGRRRGVRSPATVNRYLSAIRSAWNWGRSAGLIAPERGWPTKLMLKEPDGRTRFLSAEEIETLLKAAEGDQVMRAAILVSIATGLRQGELLRLKWRDIDFEKQDLTVMISKNATRRRVHLTATAVEALKALRESKVVSPVTVFLARGGTPLKKSLLETRWRKIREAAKLDDFHWHDLRHTCASVLAQNGSTLLEIGSVLGHKSPSMTMRYSHLIQGKPVTGHAKLDELLRGK
jgi:integrase